MSESEKPTLLGRLSRIKHWLFANPLLSGIGLLSMAGVMAMVAMLIPEPVEDYSATATIEETLGAFQEGDFDRARELAEALAAKTSDPLNRGVAAYVLGRILVDRDCANERREDRQRGLYLIASRYFDEADLNRVPADLQPEVSYWWGKSLFEAGEPIAARQPLLRALDKYPEKTNDILLYLAKIHTEDDAISKEQGVAYTDRLLGDPKIERNIQNQALALKTKLLLQSDKLSEAASIYSQLSDDSDLLPSIYAELGRARLREAARLEVLKRPEEEIRQIYQEAVDAFMRDPRSPLDSDLDRATKTYLLALSQKGAGDLAGAATNFTHVRRLFFDQPIGIAAGFWESLCLLEQGDFKEAEGLYSGMLKETVRANNQGETEWLNQETISELVQRGVDYYLSLGNYAAAVDLADQFRHASMLRQPPIPLSFSAGMKVKALKNWIEQLEIQKEQVAFRDRPKVDELLNQKYNAYGHALYSLAVNRYASSDYAVDLYESGEAFYRSSDFRRATLAFKQYLDTNDDSQAAQTRLRIGQCLLAQRKYVDALDALTSCWALYPNDPVVYQARYQAAECYLELGDTDKAQEMLRANLDNDALTPSSQEWIESLFLLGNLLFNEGLRLEALSQLPENNTGAQAQKGVELLEQANEYYSRAILRLNEAVQREKYLPAAKMGRYHLAESYRRSNTWNRLQLRQTTVNASRIRLTSLITRYNEKGIEHLAALEEHLNLIREERPLEPNEEALLRNSYFTRGHLYYQLNKYDEAIGMYRQASNMVISKPEVLESYVQIASCYRKLNKPEEAVRIINQAKILLRDRIPATADFEATTRFSRDRWLDLLDWLSTI